MAMLNWTRPLRQWRTSRFAAIQYAWLICHQFWGWLGFLSIIAWIISLVTDRAFSFLPAWLDSFRESLPWMLLIGSVWGGYKVFEERERCHKLELGKLLVRLEPHESAAPHVEVGFTTADGISGFQTVFVGSIPTTPDIDLAVEKSRERLEQKYEAARVRTRPSAFYSSGLGHEYLRDEADYLDDVDLYLKKKRAYFHDTHRYYLARERVRPVAIALQNTGSAPLRDVVVELLLPSQIKAAPAILVESFQDEEGELLPQEPAPPPATRINMIPSPYVPPYYPHPLDGYENDQPSPRGPLLKNRSGQDVYEYRIQVVSPGEMVYNLDPCFFLFDQINDPQDVTLPVKVFSSSWPKPMETTIALKIRLARSTNLPADRAAS